MEVILENSNVIIQEIINNINETLLKQYLEKITEDYKGRVTGSSICDQTGEWIFNEFKKMSNLKVKKQSWLDNGNFYNFFKIYKGQNIEAEISGTQDDDIIIFSAHFDVGNSKSQGALDNGAGVAALLTVASVLSNYEFNSTIRFVAFSGEEQGLLGSYNYAKKTYYNEEDIIAVINADVIGNNTYETDRYHTLRAFATYRAGWIVDIMNKTSSNYGIGIYVDQRIYRGNSDDKAFDDYGYPAMQLFHSGDRMEKFYGNLNDTIELINFSYVENVSRVIAASLAVLADLNYSPDGVRIVTPLENSLYFKNKLINLVKLDKGVTLILGNFKIKADLEVNNNSTPKVTFELLEGENEYEYGKEDREILANYTDNTFPYEWKINYRCFGWHTIRVKAYYSDGNLIGVDEIEIFIISF